MSNLYSLYFVLNVPFSKEYIAKILIRGAENGFCYIGGCSNDSEGDFISLEQVAENIIHLWEEEKGENKTCISPGIGIKFKGIFFHVYFTEKFGCLAPWLGLYSHGWCKEKSYVDFERYIRLFFLAIQDVEVLWLKTYDEGYEEDLYWGVELSYPQLRKLPDLSFLPDFTVDVTILPTYSYEVLYNILDHGSILGWRYFIKTHYDNVESVTSIEQAAAYILDKIYRWPIGVTFICSANDFDCELTFALRVNARASYSMLTVKPLKTSSVHLKQVVSHLLDLCTDFSILELKTFDARYNYIRNFLGEVK